MCAYSASDIDFYTAGSSFHSAVLVSKSRHASVYRCCFASSGSSTQRPCCLKTVRIDGPLLRHQLNLLTRLAAASKAHLSHGSVHEGAEFDVLPLLRFGAIPAYAREKYDATLYVATPWVEGLALSRLITKVVGCRRPVSICEALTLLRAVAVSIRDFSRCCGDVCLVHHDIKPSNILVSKNPHLRATVIDLDTAFFLDETPREALRGSYGYTAPEGILRTDSGPNETMDVFSFGVVAHEVLTGCWPYAFPPRSDDGLLFWSSYFRQKRVLPLSEGLPFDIRDLIGSCLSFDPHERPSHECLVEHLDVLVSRYAEKEGASCVFEETDNSSRVREHAKIPDTF